MECSCTTLWLVGVALDPSLVRLGASGGDRGNPGSLTAGMAVADLRRRCRAAPTANVCVEIEAESVPPPLHAAGAVLNDTQSHQPVFLLAPDRRHGRADPRLIEQAGGSPHAAFLEEMVGSTLRLIRNQTSRGDIKIPELGAA